MFENLREDYRRVASRRHGPLKRALLLLFNYGFIAVAVYRFGRFARGVRVPVLGFLLRVLYFVAKTLVEILFGIWIDVSSNIGPGFYIGHFSGIFIHGDLGRNCSVGQGVTVGAKGAGKSDGWPSVGDNVYIGTGAKVIGRIRVGNNVVIGANAVVVKDVPDDSLAVGVPARVQPRSEAAAEALEGPEEL
jgi:serine O-acetyltransferase